LYLLGDLTIYPNAVDNLNMRFGPLIMFGPAVTGTKQKINTNGAVIGCTEVIFNQYYGCQLLSDFVTSWDTRVTHTIGTLELNGWGLTVGQYYWDASLIKTLAYLSNLNILASLTSNPAVLKFTPRPDNAITGENNLSYVYVIGADYSYSGANTFYYNNSTSFAPYQTVSFSGQRPMIIFGYDTNLALKTSGTNAYGLTRTVDGIWRINNSNSDFVYNATSRPPTKNLLDFYFIDGTPFNGYVESNGWDGACTKFSGDNCWNTVDFTGTCPGDNTPQGFGCPHPLVLSNLVNYAFMGHVLLNAGQYILSTSKTYNSIYPSVYFWHVSDIADQYNASSVLTRQPSDGWQIDLQNNIINTTQTSSGDGGNTNITLGPNTDIYFVNSFYAYKLNIYADDNSSHIFIVGNAGIFYQRTFIHYSGVISTVFGDGTSVKIAFASAAMGLAPHNPASILRPYVSFTTFYPYTMAGGQLDLYGANDIVLIGDAYISDHLKYYVPTFFLVTGNAVINFYFNTFYGPEIWYGMIQTDSFSVSSGITLYTNVWSDIGNLVTAPPFNYPAIAVTGTGNSNTPSGGQPTPRTTTYPEYRTSIVWNELGNIILQSLGVTNPIALDRYQSVDRSLASYASFTSGGPLTVAVIRQTTNVAYTTYGTPGVRMIWAKSGNTAFTVTSMADRNQDYLYFNASAVSGYEYQPYIAGLDLTQSTNLNVNVFDSHHSATNGGYFIGTGLLKIGCAEGGSIFDSAANSVTYFYPYYYNNLDVSGGSKLLPAIIDIQQLFIGFDITITGGYYTIGGLVNSSKALQLGNNCTLDQTLNTSDNAPTFNSINLDYGSASGSSSKFIHGRYNGNNYVTFYVSGNNKTVWSSQRYGLTITTTNSQGQQSIPGIIVFTYNGSTGSRYVLPGGIDNYGEQANTPYVANTPGKNTPDQNALVFDFYNGYNNSPINSSDSIFIGDLSGVGSTQTVQTILLGTYYDPTSWQGFSGNLYFQRDVIFLASDAAPSQETIYSPYYDDSQYIIGGLHQGLSKIGSATGSSLYFQGSGFIWLNSALTPGTAYPAPNVYVGSNKYQYYIQLNQPGLLAYNTYYGFNKYYGPRDPGQYTSKYNISGSYKNLFLQGGLVGFYNQTIYAVSTITSVINLTVQDTIGKTSKGGFTLVDITNHDGNYFDIGVPNQTGVGSLTTYASTSTGFYFYASSQTILRFANGLTFNANLGTYTNIAISINSTISNPSIAINPCANNADGSPAVDTVSRATFDSLIAPGGPVTFKFASGSTSTFRYFTYNDDTAPYSSKNNWYAYNNTLSNTALISTQKGFPWYISISTPHRGTLKSSVEVSNMTIQDSVAVNPYIWFAPGTVNRYANTGTSFRPGYTNNSVYYTGTNVSYYNYDAGGNSGWVFHQLPTAGMDLAFWDNPPFQWSSSTNHSHVTQSWSSTNYTTPGSFIWVAPSNVYSVSVTAIGGGGGGTTFGNPTNTGGGGGSVAWRANIPVQPNQSYVVVVGAGGAPNNRGGSSYFINSSTVYAPGGGVGTYSSSGVIAAGGDPIGIPVGDGFGLGQTGSGGEQYTGRSYLAGGGGAAGDYSAVIGNVYGSTMLYPVTYYPAWSNFMNSYAVWVNPDSVNPLNSAVRITRIITVPISQSYTFEIQADNGIDLYIDDTVTTVVSYGGFTTSTYYSQLLSAGQHTIIMDVTNAGGPGGVAIRITDESGVQYWNTRSMLNPSGGAANGVTSTTSTVSLQGGGGAGILGLVNPIGSTATSSNGGLYGGGGSGSDSLGYVGAGAGGAVRISWPGFSAPK
jgi:hypothetical protein